MLIRYGYRIPEEESSGYRDELHWLRKAHTCPLTFSSAIRRGTILRPPRLGLRRLFCETCHCPRGPTFTMRMTPWNTLHLKPNSRNEFVRSLIALVCFRQTPNEEHTSRFEERCAKVRAKDPAFRTPEEKDWVEVDKKMFPEIWKRKSRQEDRSGSADGRNAFD